MEMSPDAVLVMLLFNVTVPPYRENEPPSEVALLIVMFELFVNSTGVEPLNMPLKNPIVNRDMLFISPIPR